MSQETEEVPCCALCLYFCEFPWYVRRADGYCNRPYCYARTSGLVGDQPPLSIPNAKEVICRYFVDRATYFESLHIPRKEEL